MADPAGREMDRGQRVPHGLSRSRVGGTTGLGARLVLRLSSLAGSDRIFLQETSGDQCQSTSLLSGNMGRCRDRFFVRSAGRRCRRFHSEIEAGQGTSARPLPGRRGRDRGSEETP